ncbi:E3 ubiquitin-protein ligase RNF216 isoform X2 [Ooceraea biroi]|uniref:E3 ubiquitin-protein ligase n=1 Tax=Ooceraea biroi TaxID=2015173 RepID=A0A026WGS6_OOCBI|nr:E3 ubiquitin-protein ligase RNF216 isoform X2 [Ooceraea biroi]EZA54896.1 E3 ubiquitin-protein ligase [Ooceraea biroi]
MFENIQEDAREIKRQLLDRGQEVDENVICELLESVEEGMNRIEHVINMIMDIQDPSSHEFSDEAGPSDADASNNTEMYQSVEEVSKLDAQNSLDHGDTIALSSDSDDDTDFYYQTSNFDDISVVDTVTRSSPSHSLLDMYNVTSSPSQVIEIVDQAAALDNNHQDAAEVEFLEENNNDPNNNLDSAQMLEEMQNNSTDVADETSRLFESPKPGCSKDSDDDLPAKANNSFEEQQKDAEGCTVAPSVTDCCSNDNETFDSKPLKKGVKPSTFFDIEELEKEAKQIYTLLPHFDYYLIYKILLSYQYAKNRIELTLWSLLPKKRPVIQYIKSRRLSIVKISSVKCTKSSNNQQSLEKDSTDVKAASSATVKQTCAENEEGVLHVKTKNEKLVSPVIDRKRYIMEKVRARDETGSNTVPKKAKLSKDDVNIDASTSTAHEHSEKADSSKSSKADSGSNEEPQSTFASVTPPKAETDGMQSSVRPASPRSSQCVLRPPKLMINYKVSPVAQSSSAVPSTSILATPKFVYSAGNSTQVSNVGKCSASPGTNAELRSPNPWKVRKLLETYKNKPWNLRHEQEAMDLARSIAHSHPYSGSIHFSNRPLTKTNATVRSSLWRAWQEMKNFPITPMDAQAEVDEKTENVETPSCSHRQSVVSEQSEGNPTTHGEDTSSQRPARALDNSRPVLSNKTPSNVETEEAKKLANDVYVCTVAMPVSQSTVNAEYDKFPYTEAGTSGMPTTNISEESRGSENDGKSHLDQKDGTVGELRDKQNKEQETILLNEKALKIYYKLIPMFPCISTDYIKRLCQQHVKDDGQVLNEAMLLQYLAEQLLDFGQQHPLIIKKPKPEPEDTYDVNEQYADLLGIFPEADPVYLRQIAENNDPEKIKEFVQSQLEKPNYPTREQYLAKKKITEQQKRYTTDFQVQQFLQIFPDPFSYFEDDKRQCQFHPHAVDFLKHHFNKIRVNTLLKLYSDYKHNLSLTAKNLEKLTPNMKTKRYPLYNQLLTADIPLLQECAFIQHKAEFRKHLAELKAKEEKEFNELKAKNELFECQCCYDNECMPSKCSTCEDGHIFCNSCIVRSTDVVLGDGKTQVDCLINCGCGFPLSVLQRVLLPTKFSILLRKRQEAEVMAAGLDGLVSCPFCHFASIPPAEDKVFKCLNPDCMKESCRLCKELNHIPLKCNEAKSDAARLYLEEKMTEALIRKCYRCGKTFFKEEGCNKMTCVCGAQMCYICDKPVTNYEHFRGQGASPSNSKLCPLWSDDRRMNAESVIKVCQETMKHIKEKNPNVDINVGALLPKLPPKSRGPHEDVPHINALPMRADRIARQIP